MSSSTTISGVSSGIDWRSTIDSLMQIERRKVTLLENRQSSQQQKLDAWRTLNSSLLALQSKSDEFATSEGLLAYKGESTDTSVLRVEASANAAEGTYGILVDTLASSSRVVHGGWADSNNTAVNSSGADQVFAFTYGTGDDQESISINIPDGTTLAGLKDLINRADDNPGLRATILNDGSGSATAYHLVMTTAETGAQTALAIDDGLTTLGGFDSASIVQNTVGQNARFRIDGYPAGSWLESASNSVSDALDGVTLTLLKVSEPDEETRVNVSRDLTEVKARINQFVGAYNDVLSKINLYSAYDSENESLGLLFGDSNLTRVERELSRLSNRPMVGLPDTVEFTLLSQIGITTGEGGLLKVDSDKLDAALEENFADVGRLFAFTESTTNASVEFFTRTARVPAGDYAVAADYDASGALLSATIDGEPAGIEGRFIVGAEGTAAEGLRMLFTKPTGGAGSLSATVRLGLGVAAAAAQAMSAITDTEDGIVHYQTDRLDEGIASLQEQIDDMETRLLSVRANYERQYLAMESTLSRLQAQSQSLSSTLG